MASRLFVYCAAAVAALSLVACGNDVELSSPESSQSSEQSSDQDGDGEDTQANGDDVEPEEELTEEEKQAILAEEAAALAVRMSFDELVFGCGLDLDVSQCALLRDDLDESAIAELVTRCDILDQVACAALEGTVVADLQVLCVYEGQDEACGTLVETWGNGEEEQAALVESMGAATIESLDAGCLLGGVLECAEMAKRQP